MGIASFSGRAQAGRDFDPETLGCDERFRMQKRKIQDNFSSTFGFARKATFFSLSGKSSAEQCASERKLPGALGEAIYAAYRRYTSYNGAITACAALS